MKNAMPMVKLYASLRKITGLKEITLTAQTAGEVVGQLVKEYPVLETQLLENDADAEGNKSIRPHVIITVNRQHIKDMHARVTENDLIAIFPPIAGGSGN